MRFDLLARAIELKLGRLLPPAPPSPIERALKQYRAAKALGMSSKDVEAAIFGALRPDSTRFPIAEIITGLIGLVMVFMTLPMIMSVASSTTSIINTGSSATNAMAGSMSTMVAIGVLALVGAFVFMRS